MRLAAAVTLVALTLGVACAQDPCFEALKECEEGSRGLACVNDPGSFLTFPNKEACCEADIPAAAECVQKHPECFDDEVRQRFVDFLKTCETMDFDVSTSVDYSDGSVQCESVRDFCAEKSELSAGFNCISQEVFFDTNGKREACCNEHMPPYVECLQSRADACPIDGDFGSTLSDALRTCQVLGLPIDTGYDYSSGSPDCEAVQDYCENATPGFKCITNKDEADTSTEKRACCEQHVSSYSKCVTDRRDACPIPQEKQQELVDFVATCDVMNLPFTSEFEAADGSPDCSYAEEYCEVSSKGFECATQSEVFDKPSPRASCCRNGLPAYGDCLFRFSERCSIPEEKQQSLTERLSTCVTLGFTPQTSFDFSGGAVDCNLVRDFCADASSGKECVDTEGDFSNNGRARRCCVDEIPSYDGCLAARSDACSVPDSEMRAIDEKLAMCAERGFTPRPTPVAQPEELADEDEEDVPSDEGEQAEEGNEGEPSEEAEDEQENGSEETPADGEDSDAAEEGEQDSDDEDPEAEPTPTPESDPACFPADAEVELEDGTMKRMGELKIGDKIRSSSTGFSEVFAFSHRDAQVSTEFVRIEAGDVHIELSAGHYLPVDGKLVAAGATKVGDSITTASSGVRKISAVGTVQRKGLYNPHTMDGDIVVNGVVASTYTQAVPPRLAQALLLAPKALYRLGFKDPLFSLLDRAVPAFIRQVIPSSPEAVV